MVANVGPPEQEPGHAKRQEEIAWKQIVADLSSDPALKEPSALDRPDDSATDQDPVMLELTSGQIPATSPDADAMFVDHLLGDEAFVPEEPPRLSAPHDVLGRLGWMAVIGGPTLILAAGLLNWGSTLVIVGMGTTMTGMVMLWSRMPHHRDDDDDGAVV